LQNSPPEGHRRHGRQFYSIEPSIWAHDENSNAKACLIAIEWCVVSK